MRGKENIIADEMHPGEYFERLLWMLEKEAGIPIRPEKIRRLRSVVLERMVSLCLKDPARYVEYATRNPSELEKCITHLVNQETYFFRERPQLRTFRELLAEVRQRKQGGTRDRKTLRILSAGCAAGEEPYTINIIAKESGFLPEGGWKVEITGVDINENSIARALNASYRENSLRLSRKHTEFLGQYFEITEGKTYDLKPSWKKDVSFRTGNLLKEKTFRGLKDLDFIFCRNVFLYMTREAIETVAGHLHTSLSGDGCLFLSLSENLSEKITSFKADHGKGILFYRKNPAVRS